MPKVIPTSNDNQRDMEHGSYRIDDITKEKFRATHDEDTHTRLDSLITQGSALNTLRSLSYDVTTTEIELKTDTTRLPNRQVITVFNDSVATIYYGPTGVTSSGPTKGIPLLRNQMVSIPASDILAVFIIAATGTRSIIVQEWGL